MNARTIIITLALLSLGAVGCVAQVGQPEEKTGTTRSTLGKGESADDPPPGDPGEQSTDTKASDPGNNSTSGDNQGPQPLPWTASESSPSGGTEQKK
jgi:hypothetical protein